MKACPYCAEQIQDDAIKCRFCGSSVGAGAAPPVAAASGAASGAMVPADGAAIDPLRPPGVSDIQGAAQMALQARPIFGGQPSWRADFWQYVGAVLTAVVGIGLIWLLALELRRRNTHFRITERAIDYEYGVFSKRIETTQLWRVRDLKFEQSLLDRMLGIAHIHVYTQDVTDPNLIINGLPGSREVFERLRSAIDVSKQGRNVIGVVE